MRKTVLIVSGGAEAVPGIRRARELGLHVVVADHDPAAPGMALADDQLVISTYDARGMAEAAARFARAVRRIDGVLSIAANVPLTVATVAERLGLPGPSIETARLASDKLAMKERFASAGVPIPWYQAVESATALAAIARQRGLPLVIKPVDSRGARGVLRLTPAVDLGWAFDHSRSASPTGRVMVEEYLPGPQYSTESVLLASGAWMPGLAERNYERLERFAPFIIEDGGQQPPDLSPVDRQALADLTEAAGRALGVTQGIVKGDLVITPDGPRVIEVAVRLSGGWFSTDQVPLATGVDLVGAAIKMAVGEPLDPATLVPQRRQGVAIRYFFPRAGRVESIEDEGRFRNVPGINRIGFFVRAGDRIGTPTNHTQRAGFVIATGATCAEAVGRAESVARDIRIATVETGADA